MTNFSRFYCFLAICATTLNSSYGQTWGGSQTIPVPSAPSLSEQKIVEVHKKLSELYKKVNEQPEIQNLRFEVAEAQKAYVAAVEAAIAKEDPNILAIARALPQPSMALSGATANSPTAKVRPGFAQLSPEDRDILLETRRIATNLPAVKAAQDKRDEAKTEDERQRADADYRAALRKAMIEVDAKVVPILDELEIKTP